MTTTTGTPSLSTVFLDTFDPVEGNWRTTYSTTNIDGTPYAHSITSCGDEVIDFDLSRDFTIFQATAGVADTSRSDTLYSFEIYVDNELRQSEIMEVGGALPVEIDVTDALRLSLHMDLQDGNSGSCLAVGEARVK